jgi:hypothetical protein
MSLLSGAFVFCGLTYKAEGITLSERQGQEPLNSYD